MQYRPQFLISFRDFPNFTSIKEFVIRCYSYLPDTTVNAYNLPCRLRVRDILLKNYVQKYAIPSQKQVSGTPSPVKILPEVFRNNNGKPFSAINSKNRDFVTTKPYIVASVIESYRALLRFRTCSLLPLFQSCFNRFKNFCGFHPSRNSKLRGKTFSGFPVSFMVERHSIRVSILPTCFTDIVKGLGISLNSWLDNLRQDVQLDFNCSCKPHIHILPHYFNNVKLFKRRWAHSSTSTRLVVSCAENHEYLGKLSFVWLDCAARGSSTARILQGLPVVDRGFRREIDAEVAIDIAFGMWYN
ncbi:MAG: hypothetical protein DDT33_01550 [Firmicutes bacterium]|nr:hypothetical protein [Bacillota bacterium]